MEPPLIIAHRGASLEAPENSVEAVALAFQLGANAVEVDVHLSADNQVIVRHDPDFHTPFGQWLIRDTDYEALGPFQEMAGPTLEAILQTIPENGRLFLELKPGPEIVPHVHACLESVRFPANALTVISFNRQTLDASLSRCSDAVHALILTEEQLDEAADNFAVYCLTLRDHGITGIDFPAGVLKTPELIAIAEECELETFIYTLNVREAITASQRHRIHGVTTDDVRLAAALFLVEP